MSKAVIIPLYLGRGRHIWNAVSSSGLPSTKETDIPEQVHRRVMKMFKGLEHPSDKEKKEEPGEKKVQGDLLMCINT